jgi:hypothetical protein
VLQVVVGQPHGKGGTQLGVLVSLLNEMKQFFFYYIVTLVKFLYCINFLFLNFFVNRLVGCFVDGI